MTTYNIAKGDSSKSNTKEKPVNYWRCRLLNKSITEKLMKLRNSNFEYKKCGLTWEDMPWHG